MVVYDLRCGQDHVFEAWFPDSTAFTVQAKAREIQCPYCADANIVRAPMAPNIATGKGHAERNSEMARQAIKTLTNMREFVERNCEPVGEKFAEEARKIHYGETGRRNIYGRATREEASGLREEGIEFGEIPWPVRREDA